MYDIPQDDKDCDKNLNDSDGKVESLMITDDTEINANKKSKRQSIDQTKDSQNLEIASDQYGFDSPDEFESKEAIEEKAPENKDHDYDWFINEMQKDVQPVLQKTEQNNDSGSIVTSSTSDSIEPINPSNQDIFNYTNNSNDSNINSHQTENKEADSDLERLISKYGFWGYLIALGLAFLTGLLLSFSPCTYPMIPITVSVFAGQGRSVARGFVLSLFYVGSMAVVYGIMGLIVSLIGGVFGAWLASPPVVIGIAVVFVVFSLSMFGLYELQIPASIRNKLGTKQTKGGIVGSIILGIIAALVVSPCVGPFVAGILLYIATYGSPIFGFITLFFFAIGLGTLYIIIGTFSSAINALPGAGTWMETVKKFFGFVLLLMALYFLKTVIPETLTALLAGLLLLAFSVFGGGFDKLTSDSSFFIRLKKFLGIISFIVGIYLFLGTILTSGLIISPVSNWLSTAATNNIQENSQIDWHTDLEDGLILANEQKRPVLIDTWATWCVNCKVLDKKTFADPRVAEAAKNFVALKIQLEKSGSPETEYFMDKFGLKQYSLPTTLLLNPDGKVEKIIQGVIGPEDLIKEMNKIIE